MRWCIIPLLGLGLLTQSAKAADVRFSLSSQETYVGLPVTLRIQISNASSYDQPVIPEVEGLEIQSMGTPARSPQITIINGRRTERSTITFAYRVTPTRKGSFTIPSITIIADRQSQQTEPVQLVASTSETGDLLFVEVEGNQKEIFVGQPIKLTLKIWLKPYHDKKLAVTLSEADMWRMISNRTNWGVFADRIQELASNNRRPGGHEVLRTDGEGNQRIYYEFTIDATIYPQRPGQIDVGNVRVVVDYPTALGKARDPFSSFFGDNGFPFSRSRAELQVRSIRPIVAEATVDPIAAKPIPTAGRPADYRGAVGQYRIVTEAMPTHVKAGDPIRLNIVIAGTGPMDLVQAPPLSELTVLTADFKVPREPLAGFVDGDRKGFSTTIRPRREGISRIPAIPLSYFDPDQEKFVTVSSQPISIQVDPPDMLALDAIVGHGQRNSSATGGGDSSNAQGDLMPRLENTGGTQLLANQPRATAFPRAAGILLALPPLLVLLVMARRSLPVFTRLIGRMESSARQCLSRIERAEHPEEIATALQRMFARDFGCNDDATDPASSVGRLRKIGYRDLAIRFQRICDRCEKLDSVSMIDSAESFETLKTESIQAVTAWQTRRRSLREHGTSRRCPRLMGRQTPTPPEGSPSRSGTARSSILMAMIAATLAIIALVATRLDAESPASNSPASNSPASNSPASNSPASNSPASNSLPMTHSLTHEQQGMLLAEANQVYGSAREKESLDAADAKQMFSQAADKYQIVVDSGIHNGQLYGNLANAYLQSGQIALAIANYHRALQYEPTNGTFQWNLEYAQQLAKVSPTQHRSKGAVANLRDSAARGNQWLNRHLAPRSLLGIMVVSWFVLWAAIGGHAFWQGLPWKSVASVALLVCAISAMSFSLSVQTDRTTRTGILLTTTIELREGDGTDFEVVTSVKGMRGHSVKILNQRGPWVHVVTPSGQSGWLPKKVVEII